ncbi:uncharacterized protein EI97DRAFT_433240 [Westerdykella ornata]|uniref:Uncharacterized protein n=1 Tax=Westerdykella ornata TaxID=318751 RepID=A0A6A6JJV0_WESOR|nr:uncharacterized protein EI97DRAFT_433240 [Westerdykella ornata]KAF2276403.1 hypothetical protein EI97DRAFT_433240 [Westerdykella ornata]
MSGGSDVVAETLASFKVRQIFRLVLSLVATVNFPLTDTTPQSVHATDPAFEKIIAGRGFKINPLDISPADPELSRTLTEEVCHFNFLFRGTVRYSLLPVC